MQKTENEKMLRICVVGASRGLGSEIVRVLRTKNTLQCLLLVSRNTEALESLVDELQASPSNHETEYQIFGCDLSKNLEPFKEMLLKFRPTHFFYIAGGGPFGPWTEKSWGSHLWAFKVSFLAFAELAHHLLQNSLSQRPSKSPFAKISSKDMSSVEPAVIIPRVTLQSPQIIAVGSLIAEASPDPQASSYSSAKYALRGLIENLQAELKHRVDMRLFSPGYMKTPMIPAASVTRLGEENFLNPQTVAENFVAWALDPEGEKHYKIGLPSL